MFLVQQRRQFDSAVNTTKMFSYCIIITPAFLLSLLITRFKKKELHNGCH